MTDFGVGLAAAAAATLVLSVMMLMKQGMRVMPDLDIIDMVAGMMGGSRAVGWMIHLTVGTVVYGLGYASLFAPIWPDSYWLSGILIGVAGWLVAGLMLMPMAQKGPFAIRLGFMGPLMSLLMHVIFGAVLGVVYGALVQ
ncbi:MAG: DUF6789 family protein [Bauldia sp.]